MFVEQEAYRGYITLSKKRKVDDYVMILVSSTPICGGNMNLFLAEILKRQTEKLRTLKRHLASGPAATVHPQGKQ
jgi:hypothetical protein